MSRSNRRDGAENLVALSIALNICAAFILGALWLDSASQQPSAEIKRYNTYCANADTRYRSFLSDFPSAVTADPQSTERENEKHYREQQTHWCDLLAQQTSAEATVRAAKHAAWVTWLTFIGLAVLGWTLHLTRKAVREAENATKAALAQVRPWVFVEDVKITHMNKGYGIKVIFKNFGQSPAISFRREVLVRNLQHPFPAIPIEKITNDFAIKGIPPGDTRSAVIENWEVARGAGQKTRINISWSYRLPDGEVCDEYDVWVIDADVNGIHPRQMMPVDSVNYQSSA